MIHRIVFRFANAQERGDNGDQLLAKQITGKCDSTNKTILFEFRKRVVFSFFY